MDSLHVSQCEPVGRKLVPGQRMSAHTARTKPQSTSAHEQILKGQRAFALIQNLSHKYFTVMWLCAVQKARLEII